MWFSTETNDFDRFRCTCSSMIQWIRWDSQTNIELLLCVQFFFRFIGKWRFSNAIGESIPREETDANEWVPEHCTERLTFHTATEKIIWNQFQASWSPSLLLSIDQLRFNTVSLWPQLNSLKKKQRASDKNSFDEERDSIFLNILSFETYSFLRFHPVMRRQKENGNPL